MNDQASWHTSTLSQLAALAVLFFAGGAILTAIGVVFFKLPTDTAKTVMEPFSILLNMFGAAYLAVRNATPNNSPTPPPVSPP